MAAAGTPGAPAAYAAEQATKTATAASLGASISALAAGSVTPSGGMPDIHMCLTPSPVPPHGPGVVIDGSPTVLINGLPACRQGDTILEPLGPPDKIVKGLSGTLTLLRDDGFTDEEMIEWLFTPDPSLPGTPAQALSENRGTEVKRRAQALAV